MSNYNEPKKGDRIRKILEMRDEMRGENTFDRDKEWTMDVTAKPMDNKELVYSDKNWDYFNNCYSTPDLVNHPVHYTGGSAEAIDVIEDAIKNADTPVEGMLQGQALKYLLRMWLKGNCIQDAKKAQWYLNRLVEKLAASEEE